MALLFFTGGLFCYVELMSKLEHKLNNKDTERLIGDCAVCGPNVSIRVSYVSKKNGVTHWRCETKYKASKWASPSERPYIVYKKDYCEWKGGCDFVIAHSCQLAVDHIDGDHSNNGPENLQTLCHNHHALKTHLEDNYNKPKVAAI